MFVYVRFGKDKQRPYSKKNYCVLNYEEISSPFFLFKDYLDIIGKVVFNYCDKCLLPALFEGENHSMYFGSLYSAFSSTNSFSEKKRKVKEQIYLSAVKLIRRLVISTCQTANSYKFIYCFYNYEPGVHYNNQYLSIDRQKKKKEGDE